MNFVKKKMQSLIEISSPEIKDTDRIILDNHGIKYSYSWARLKKHPNFWITKKILKENKIANVEYEDYHGCPEMYAYIHDISDMVYVSHQTISQNNSIASRMTL